MRRRAGDRRAGRLAGVVLASAVMFILQAPVAHADVDAVQGGASGIAVNGFFGVVSPAPVITLSANESSPPSALGPFTQTATGVGLGALLATGLSAVATSAGNLAGEDHAGFVESRAVVEDIVAVNGVATASSVGAACRASGDGATGFTTIQDGILFGQPVDFANPPPNTVVDVPGVGTVTLNEQVVTNVAGVASITVTAMHARTDDGFGIAPGNITAEAISSRVHCSATGTNVNVTQTTTTSTTATTTTTTTTPATPVTTVAVLPAAELATTGSTTNLLGVALVVLLAATAIRAATRRT